MTTSEATSSRSRSGSNATATANPAARAIHAPRLYVKYKRRDQHNRQGGRGGSGRRPLGTSEKTDRDQDAHRRVDAEAVPVADRIGEAVTRERIEGREPTRGAGA